MTNPPRIRTYIFAWLALLALLAATFAIAHQRLDAWNTVASMGIAAVKAMIVALVFMHLRRASAAIALAAVVGLVWLAILFGLSGTDYATRATSPAPWSSPR